MEPKYKEISLLDLEAMLRRWQKNGVTSAHCVKLLFLLIGVRDLMGEDYGYHRRNFNTLRSRLGISSVALLTDAVSRCGDFQVFRDEDGNILSFFSPIFPPTEGTLNEQATKELFDDGVMNHTCDSTSLGNNILNLNNNNINNIPKDETVTSVTRDPEVEGKTWDFKPGEKPLPKKRVNAQKMEATEDSLREADGFFHELKMHADWCDEFMWSVVRYYVDKGYRREVAIEQLAFIINERLKPFFATRKDFYAAPLEGRVVMLRNMVYEKPWMIHLKNEAEHVCRERRQKEQMEFEREIRERGTHGAYELVLADGSRFYEDPDEGTCPIPPDAPDRPGSDYFYDYCLNEWRSAVNK